MIWRPTKVPFKKKAGKLGVFNNILPEILHFGQIQNFGMELVLDHPKEFASPTPNIGPSRKI